MFLRIAAIAIVLVVLAGCSPSRGIYHTVQQGQTLYRIARTYEIDERQLARLNGIEDPTRLRVGERLFIPGVERPRPVPATVSASPADGSPAAPAPQRKPVAAAPAPKPPPAAGRPPGKAAAEPAKPPLPPRSGQFIWPLRGPIVQNFGTTGNRTCKGVEIATPEATPVLAAASGRVTYSGTGIPGYGHLVILRHEDSFFTVYGYNQKTLVEAGAVVKQGERIALSGIPPGGGRPRLHFEIRHGRAALNPIFYLP
ncbi:MAG: M23 family metallopeptidase [Desulfuromonadales bacterium]|nr:M23 family metallopeptidase [Desulfuromonadales bacterium]